MRICHPDDRKGLNPLNRLLKRATKKRGLTTPLFLLLHFYIQASERRNICRNTSDKNRCLRHDKMGYPYFTDPQLFWAFSIPSLSLVFKHYLENQHEKSKFHCWGYIASNTSQLECVRKRRKTIKKKRIEPI